MGLCTSKDVTKGVKTGVQSSSNEGTTTQPGSDPEQNSSSPANAVLPAQRLSTYRQLLHSASTSSAAHIWPHEADGVNTPRAGYKFIGQSQKQRHKPGLRAGTIGVRAVSVRNPLMLHSKLVAAQVKTPSQGGQAGPSTHRDSSKPPVVAIETEPSTHSTPEEPVERAEFFPQQSQQQRVRASVYAKDGLGNKQAVQLDLIEEDKSETSTISEDDFTMSISPGISKVRRALDLQSSLKTTAATPSSRVPPVQATISDDHEDEDDPLDACELRVTEVSPPKARVIPPPPPRLDRAQLTYRSPVSRRAADDLPPIIPITPVAAAQPMTPQSVPPHLRGTTHTVDGSVASAIAHRVTTAKKLQLNNNKV